MKKLLLIILTISASFAFNNASAQGCGNSNFSYVPGPNTPLGFQNSDSIPCAVQGVAYNDTIPFKMYSSFYYLNSQFFIDSITIDTIFNLPCGLCWSLNNARKTYAANETGSINVRGTTNDVVGQYNLRLQITAYLTGGNGTPTTEYPNTVDQAEIKIWLRVASSSGSCTPVDTNEQTNTNLTAASSCPTGINEVAANVAAVNIIPNPINSTATLTFTAEKNADYTVKITDITGQVVSVKQIQANPGINTSTIERGKLAAGMYFISLSDGVSMITRKFTIAD